MQNREYGNNVTASIGQETTQVGRQKSYRKSGVRGQVQDSTIEQMSPINHAGELDYQDLTASGGQNTYSGRNNFFREDPEKSLSRKLRNLTPLELAQKSKKLLIDDKQEHK